MLMINLYKHHMTNIPFETKQSGSTQEYKFYCYSEASAVHKNKCHLFQTDLLRKTIVGSYF